MLLNFALDFFFCGLIKLKKVFDKNSKVQLFLCLYSDGLNLRHFKLRVIDLTEFIVWNIWGLWHSLCHNWPPHVVFYITQKVLVWGFWNFCCLFLNTQSPAFKPKTGAFVLTAWVLRHTAWMTTFFCNKLNLCFDPI